MKEISFNCTESAYRNVNNQFQLKQDGTWCIIDIATSSILEIYFPANSVCIQNTNENDGSVETTEIAINKQCLTHILALCVDHIDILLEDWYPTLGTRFVHTSEGRFLVTRLIPCPKCLQKITNVNTTEVEVAVPVKEKRSSFLRLRSKSNSLEENSDMNYSWMMEECILAAYENKCVTCPTHGDFKISAIAPDIVN